VRRHGLASVERTAAAEEVAARIRELGLRTVRLAVVDQHGVPRGKMLSPAAAVAAMSDGLDFSGAIYIVVRSAEELLPSKPVAAVQGRRLERVRQCLCGAV